MSKDYVKAMHNLFDKDYKDEASREEHCQYKGKGDEYCLCTTQKSCRGCRFFTPTTQSQLKVVVEKTEELKKKIKSRDMTIAKFQEEISRLKSIVAQKEVRIGELVGKLADAAEELIEYKEKVYELQGESDNKD